MDAKWQLQEAKNNLSQVVKRAQASPQVITVHGKPNAVVISYDAYQRMAVPKTRLVEALLAPELAGDDLDFSRSKDTGRATDL